jgi:hypothetical protein
MSSLHHRLQRGENLFVRKIAGSAEEKGRASTRKFGDLEDQFSSDMAYLDHPARAAVSSRGSVSIGGRAEQSMVN